MRWRTTVLVLLVAGSALATRMWTEAEFEQFYRTYEPRWLPRPESLIHGPRRYNYLERVKLMCDFVARYQVADSTSPDFGGIIEAEHMPNIIETDNTQEAIWVWSRWYELTGLDDYRENVRRAWRYVLTHPAYWEHSGNPTSLWYAVWNCGLALMAEPRYRRAYEDSSYLAYADSCAGFLLRNPLLPGSFRDYFVAGQSSGMAYDYALERNLGVLGDSCLAWGRQVRDWIEEDPTLRLGRADWAMCGGTAFWGVCRTVCRDDTIAGKQWIQTYAESLPGFHPSGTWNCSHNIWLANAYRAAAEVGRDERWWLMHHYLVDTLLAKDTDRDGGIPATWTDPPTQDQTWVSTYLDFMGMDVFATPTYDHDVAALEFSLPDPGQVYVEGDTIPVRPVVANVGLNPETFPLTVRTAGYEHTADYSNFPFLGIDTAAGFPPIVVASAGIYRLDAITAATPDRNRLNDTSRVRFKVYGRFTLSGTLSDSSTGMPIQAWLKARIRGRSANLDSCVTDSLGRFSLAVLDTIVVVGLEPPVPYYRRSWEFTIHRDTSVALATPTAHLLLVNNDSLERYETYYTSALDSLALTYSAWRRPGAGPPPYPLLDRLRSRILIWYSGDTRTQTVPPEDRDSLSSFLGRGGRLLLTGQNIAEELAGTVFLENTLGCRFDSSGWRQFFAFGNRQDSVGRLIHATATAGGDGANNQTSRDVLSPLGTAATLMVYDTVSNACAGVRNEIPGGARVILLGFGFEAVNRPNSRPDFLTRPQLLSRLLAWLSPGIGISEPACGFIVHRSSFVVFPNPFRTACRIAAPPDAEIGIFDPCGRRVALLPTGLRTWKPGPDLRSDLYFIHVLARHTAYTTRVLYLR